MKKSKKVFSELNFQFFLVKIRYFETSGTLEENAATSALEKESAATLKQSSQDMEISVAAPELLVTTEVQMSANETMTSVSNIQQLGTGATATTSADLMTILTTLVMTASSTMASTTTAMTTTTGTTTTTTTTTTTVNKLIMPLHVLKQKLLCINLSAYLRQVHMRYHQNSGRKKLVMTKIRKILNHFI